MSTAFVLAILAQIFGLAGGQFHSSAEESKFVDSVLAKLTRYTPHASSNR